MPQSQNKDCKSFCRCCCGSKGSSSQEFCLRDSGLATTLSYTVNTLLWPVVKLHRGGEHVTFERILMAGGGE
jgi:hypothetical protein